MKNSNPLLFIAFLLLAFMGSLSAQDCDNDITPPVAICQSGVTVIAVPGIGATVFAEDINESSYDDCGAVTIGLILADDDDGTPSTNPSVTLPDVAENYATILYVVDESDNFTSCLSVITVIGENEDCTDDVTAPAPICFNGITVGLEDDETATIWGSDIIVDPNDNCDPNPVLNINLLSASTGAPQGGSTLQFDAPGTYDVEAWAIDNAGNADFCVSSVIVIGDDPCANDTTSPVAICETGIAVEAVPDFGFLLWAQDIDQGSYDECSTVELFIVLQTEDTGTPPTTSSIILPPEVGPYIVVLYAVDQSGNWTACWAEVSITGLTGEGCTTDDTPPTLFCQAALNLTLNPISGIGIVFADSFVDSVTDDCDTNPTISVNLSSASTGAPQGITELLFDTPGLYEVETWATDNFGNFTNCLSVITVEDSPLTDCDNDIIAPSIACDGSLHVAAQPDEPVIIGPGDIEVITYDACGEVSLRMILASDSDGTLPASTSVELPGTGGWYDVEVWAVDESGNTNVCVTSVFVNVQRYIKGNIYNDANDNCGLDAGESGTNLTEWTVRVSSTNSNRTRTVTTDNLGNYSAHIGTWPTEDLTDVAVELILPDGMASGCVTSVIVPDATPEETFVDFAAVIIEDCIFTTVDVASPFLRRCFDNNILIDYANYSTEVIEDAVMTIDLDPFIELNGATVPYNDLGNNRYELIIGFMAPTSTGTVILDTYLSCDAELGATHCIQATILPFTCIPTTSFSELTVTGECDPTNDQVNFTIANTGNSNMATAQNFRIVEDVIMYMTADPIQLDAGQSEQFIYPANGATWRLEIDQEESFPYGGTAAAFVEGCGGFTQGIATQFLLSNSKPNADLLCLENIGSWDPNDKQALPRGYGDEHYIEADTPLEYLIRFQNTGTDTAFNVRIEDQLSEHLNPGSLVPGASSHPYRMELKEDGELLFHFDNIMLPDSSTNFEASNGFVQFSIRQHPDNPIGTIIENTAGIYFDFNEAVVTNTVMHTIGENFIIVKTWDIPVPGVALSVVPNPLQTTTKITLKGIELPAGQCLLYDAQGRLIGQRAFNGQEVELSRSDFATAGLYFFRVVAETQVVAQGKLMVK